MLNMILFSSVKRSDTGQMKHTLKILLISVVSIVAIVVAAIAAVGLFLDPNDFRDDLARMAQEKTGRKLQIEGDLAITFFPWLGAEVNNVSMGSPAGFAEGDFITAKRANARVRVMSLFGDSPQVDRIELIEPTITLIKDKQGRGNWEMDGVQQADDAADGTAKPQSVSLSGVTISNASLTFKDLASGSQTGMSHLNLSIDGLSPGSASTIELSTKLNLPGQEPAEIKLTTELLTDEGFNRVQATGLNLKAADSPLGEAELSADIDLNLTTDKLNIRAIKLTTAALEVEGKVALDALSTDQKISGDLVFSGEELATHLGLDALPEGAFETLRGKLRLGGTSLRPVVSIVELTLDDTHASGRLVFSKTLVFKLKADSLDLERYRPESSDSEAQVDQKAALLTPAMLPASPISGTLEFGTLKVAGLTLSNLTTKMGAGPKQIKFDPLEAELYQGTFSGHVHAVKTKSGMNLTLSGSAEKIDADPLIQDLVDKDLLRGRGDLKFNLHTQPGTLMQLRESLSGQVEFIFRDGAVKGINVAEMIRKAGSLLGTDNGGQTPQESPETDFSSLSASLQIKKGIARNQDLSMMSPLLRISGEGDVDLVKSEVDYLLKPALVDSIEGQGGKSRDKLKGVVIPVRIRGPFDKLSYKVDVGKAVTDQKKEELKGKATEKLFDLLGGKKKKKDDG